MDDLARVLVTLALAATAATFLGSFLLWFGNEERRIGRALKRVLNGPAEAVLIAPGRGRAAGLSTETGLFATAWDKGDWCMVYRLDEVTGGELLVDGEVVARAFRGENRRPLDRVPAQARAVTLRLIFDDARYPDFELELWAAGDETRREGPTPAIAAQAANQWLARIEAIVRRPKPVVTAAPPPVVQTRPKPAPPPEPEGDDGPPWDEEAPDLFDEDEPEERGN